MDQDLKDELTSSVDDFWAETIRVLAMDAGQPDASRPAREIDAVLRTNRRNADNASFGRGKSARVGLSSDGAELRVDRTSFHDLILRKGDKVVALDRLGEPVFEIQTVDDRSHLRLICGLGDA